MKTTMVQFNGSSGHLSFEEGREDDGPITVSVTAAGGTFAAVEIPNDAFEQMVRELSSEVERRASWRGT